MVNTFILSNDIKETMKILDYKRLGKQRVEAMQIINILTQIQSLSQTQTKIPGWSNHPIVLMWKGYINGLKYYCNCAIDEWIARGYKNTMEKYVISDFIMPWWCLNIQVQMSHRASLYRKDPIYYDSIRPSIEYINTGYIWISKLNPDLICKMQKGDIIDLNLITSTIGTGAPSQYRYSINDVQAWLKNKNVNPKTNRKISRTGKIYKDYHSASKFYKLNDLKIEINLI